MISMILFQISYPDIKTFVNILAHHNLNIQGMRDIHVYTLIQKLLQHYRLHGIERLFEYLHTPEFIQTCREFLCISTGEFFRDPSLWVQLKSIFKSLSYQENINILFSRVASGEELYSLLIFLQEHDMLQKTTLHATEVCNIVLQQAKAATYSIKSVQNGEKNFQEIGFSKSLLEYFEVLGNTALAKSYLAQNTLFYTTDIQEITHKNKEYDIIWHRNQLIYWNIETANKHLTQMKQALKNNRYLILGYIENLSIYPVSSDFEVVSFEDKIYSKK